MLPLELPIGRKELLAHVWEVSLLSLLLMTLVISYISGGLSIFRIPYWIINCRHCLRLTPRLLTQFIICISLAQLFHLTVKRPQFAPIESFDDLIASNIHIFGLRAEFDLLENDFRARYAEAFRLTRNLSEFFRMRNSFNTSWAYSVATNKWVILQEQQRHFQRPLFRYSDLCFSESHPQSILLGEDSIYYNALQVFTMRMQQSGILHHWMQHSLYDMVKAGRIELKDYSTLRPMMPLSMEDLQLAWRCCGAGLVLALSAFVVELLRFYVNVCLDLL